MHASQWRELDRALFQFKRAYFSREMQGFTARNPDMRPEHYEVKGRQLVKPSHAGSRRNRVFTLKILDLAQQLDVRLFAAVWRKDPANPVDAMSMYTQGTRNLDFQVAASHLSYIFGNPVGRNYTTLVEAPMFVDSVALRPHHLGERRAVLPGQVRDELRVVADHHLVRGVAELVGARDPPLDRSNSFP